jgi:23S rRNA (pseudouridine1915-N3)-methyltransferase
MDSLSFRFKIISMKILILNIGKTKEKYIATGIDLYLNRLKHYAPISYIELKDVKSKNAAIDTTAAEYSEMEKHLQLDDLVILLDEHGKQYSSVEFSEELQKYRNRSVKNIVFIIGGAYGHHEELKKKAHHMMSLSKMTFTHEMARLLFLEQLYRAFTILANEKYHNP